MDLYDQRLRTHPVICDTCVLPRLYSIERLGECCGMILIGGICVGTLQLHPQWKEQEKCTK